MQDRDKTQSQLANELAELRQKVAELTAFEARRQQLEEALQASEARYQRIIQAMTDYIYSVRVENGRAVETRHGAGCVAVTGYTSEEYEADPYLWLRMVAERDRPAVEDQVRRVLAGEEVSPLEHRIMRKDGVERWVRNTPVLHRDDGGKLLAYDGVVQDITERKRAEGALKKSEVRYRMLFEGSPVILLEQDFSAVKAHLDRLREAGVQDFRSYFQNNPEAITQCAALIQVMDVNQAALDWYRVKNKETLRTSLSQMLGPKARDSFREELVAIAEGKAHFELESTRGTQATGYTHMVIKWAVVPGHEDTWANVLVSIFDITERRRAEAALKESLLRQTALLDNIPDLAWLKDQDSRFIAVNEPFGRSCGVLPQDLVGKNDLDIWPEELARSYRADDREVMRSRMRKRVEERMVDREGNQRWIETIKTPILDASGEAIGTVGIARDITERKQAEAEREVLIQELEAKNAELESFSYTASHDLKSPLITIKGFLGFLEQDLLTGNAERMKADLGRIANAADKMEQLLDELLELSRIGRLVNPPERVSFGDLAREAVSMIAGRLAKRGVRVDIALDLPLVYGDRHRLGEVLENLVDNAVKFMGEQPDPRVEIGVRHEGDQAVFYVRDNGVGIDPRYHDRVFGLFEKLDTKSEGSGIGLAIVKRIVEVHGGRIWVESEGPGRGSLFCFTLPESRVSTNTQE